MPNDLIGTAVNFLFHQRRLRTYLAMLVVIEAWRREYSEEWPKKSLGGLTPATYAKKLAEKTVTLTTGL